MKLFLAHASEDKSTAEAIVHALHNADHEVFFAPSSVLPGDDYNATILEELDKSDGLIFLISKYSVRRRWLTAELDFAKKKWKSAKGHVLPVMLEELEDAESKIDAYLRSVNILKVKSRDSAPVEVMKAVKDWQNLIVTRPSDKQKSGSVFGQFLQGLLTEMQRSQSPSRERAPIADPLAELLPGVWQIELTYPNRMRGQGTAEFYGNGTFRAQGRSPAFPMFVIEGSWEVLRSNQIMLTGQQSDGYRGMPFNATILFSQTMTNMLAGVMSTGEQVALHRVA